MMEIKRDEIPDKAKIIRYCRHSINDGRFVNAKGQQLIKRRSAVLKKGINQIDIFFYSPHLKTLQTVVSLMSIWKYYRKKVIQINELHSSKIELILHRYYIDYEKDGGKGLGFLSWLYREENLSKTEIFRLANIAKRGLKNSFDELEDGQTGLIVGHDSTLSLTLYFYTEQKKIAIPELSFIDFAEIDGKIYLVKL